MPFETSSITEKELLSKIAGGDEVSFKVIFNRFKNKIYSLSMYLTHSECVSEDITQEVFMKIWQNRSELEHIDFFNSYLRTITYNVACNHLKRVANERVILGKILDESDRSSETTESTVFLNDYQNILKQAIDKLPPQQRRVYIMSRHEGFKHEEIANRMKISVNTVREYLKIARYTVRKFVGDKIGYSVIAAIHIFLNE